MSEMSKPLCLIVEKLDELLEIPHNILNEGADNTYEKIQQVKLIVKMLDEIKNKEVICVCHQNQVDHVLDLCPDIKDEILVYETLDFSKLTSAQQIEIVDEFYLKDRTRWTTEMLLYYMRALVYNQATFMIENNLLKDVTNKDLTDALDWNIDRFQFYIHHVGLSNCVIVCMTEFISHIDNIKILTDEIKRRKEIDDIDEYFVSIGIRKN